MSEGGLFVETNAPPHVGENARVELFPPGWPQPLLLTGVVVRAELTGYALRLDAPNEKSKGQLKTLVAQVANETSGPAVKSVTEAQQRLGEMEAELRDTKERLARVQADAESNRAYLERALAQAGAHRTQGNSNLVLGIAAAGSFIGGVVLATIISVARAPDPPSMNEISKRNPASAVRALDEAGPRRPTPLPMAAIFSDTVESSDAGVGGDSGPAAKKIVPAMANTPPRPGASNAPGADVGRLNFISSAPASVLIDDEKVGNTPLKSMPLKPGTYKLQFQCGTGPKSDARKLEVLPFSETDVEHRCQ